MSPSFRASSSKTRMNSSPIRCRFSSGSSTPSSRARKRSCACDVHERHVEVAAERLGDLLGLVRAHEAVVDEDARELVADRLVDEQRRDRGVDAAGEPADHPLRADLRADPLDLLLDHGRRRPRRAARRRCRRGSSSARPGRAACARPRGGTGRRRAAAPGPRTRRPASRRTGPVTVGARGRRDDRVAVAHPDDLLRPAARRRARPAPSSSSVLPNSEAPVRATSPPSSSAISCAP